MPRTVPGSRVGSSKLSRLEVSGGPGKRSRSAASKSLGQPIPVHNLAEAAAGDGDWFGDGKHPASVAAAAAGQGKRSRSASEEVDIALSLSHHDKFKGELDKIGRRRLSKVETVRVLRARSALLLPLPPPPLVPHYPLPLVLKSEERGEGDKKTKKRR